MTGSNMKRLIALIFAPLLVLGLMSFTPPSVQQHQVHGTDSTTVNVQFSPASIVVSDNRTTSGIVSIIERNSESNAQVANAIEKIAEISDKGVSLQERRYGPLMDRITQQTGLTQDEVTKIIHKKRVYDITFYTLFTIFIIYLLVEIAKLTSNTSMTSIKGWTMRLSSSLIYLLLLYLAYLAIGTIVNGVNYPIIQAIINTPPG